MKKNNTLKNLLLINLGMLTMFGCNNVISSSVDSQEPSIISSEESSENTSSSQVVSSEEISSSNKDTSSEVISSSEEISSSELVLDAVSDLAFGNDSLTFTAVENADEYLIEFYKGEEKVTETVINTTSLDVTTLDLAGNYNVKVYALKGEVRSESSSIAITILSIVNDMILEAEEGLYNYGAYRGNPLAHNGVYVGGIDNCGQGVYYNVFCYVEGEYDFDCYYTTGAPVSLDEVWVNGSYQATFSFTENTGWGSATSYNPALATVKINLLTGWNTISVMKNGNDTNNYGGWAELDYFVLKGGNKKYNIDDFTEYDTSMKDSYRLEAEMAAQIGRTTNEDSMTWGIRGNAPTPCSGASNGFIMANINDMGQGLEWRFSAPKEGTYELKISFAHAYENDFSTVFFYNSTYTLRDTAYTNESLSEFNKQPLSLDQGNGWSAPIMNTRTIDLSLQKGDNFIYAIRETECWFQIDYIELSLKA